MSPWKTRPSNESTLNAISSLKLISQLSLNSSAATFYILKGVSAQFRSQLSLTFFTNELTTIFDFQVILLC